MRTILLSLSALVLSGGLASADTFHGNSSQHGARGGGGHTQVTRVEHRGNDNRRMYDNHRVAVRDHRIAPRIRYAPSRTIVRQRYYNYRVRPQVIIQNPAPLDGYLWVAGQWQWNGYEWLWTDGHYELAAGYDSGY